MSDLSALLTRMRQLEATEVHLRCDELPRFRLGFRLDECEEFAEFGIDKIQEFASLVLSARDVERWKRGDDLHVAWGNDEIGRFRCSFFREHRGPAATFRVLSRETPDADRLGLPRAVRNLVHLKRGLVLISGQVRSGKTSTLHALLRSINLDSARHIITIEDPIEAVETSRRSLVHQRAVGAHVLNVAEGIRLSKAQDPDVLVLGDLDSTEAVLGAIEAAENGALVLAAIRARVGVVSTLERLLSFVPFDDGPRARLLLSECLEAVVYQELIDRADRSGVALASEVLIPHPTVRSLIREQRFDQIPAVFRKARRFGSHSLDDSLEELVTGGFISQREATRRSRDRSRFERVAPLR